MSIGRILLNRRDSQMGAAWRGKQRRGTPPAYLRNQPRASDRAVSSTQKRVYKRAQATVRRRRGRREATTREDDA